MKSIKDPKILLVEDNYVNQKLVVLMLKNLNFQCDVASDGKQAFEMFQKDRYDLIFMDIQMPVMDGWESTKLIRDFEKSLGADDEAYIVALSANQAADFGDKQFDIGMNGFIEKPLRIERLSSFIKKWLESRM